MVRFVVMVGNPSDGFYLHGPFDNEDAAAKWAEISCEGWWIMPLESPNTIMSTDQPA